MSFFGDRQKHWWAWTSARFLALVMVAYWLAWLLRFDFVIPASESTNFRRGLVIVVCVKLIVILAMGLRQVRVWPHLGFSDVVQLFWVHLQIFAISTVSIYAVVGSEFPRSVYLLDPLVFFLVSGFTHFVTRFYREVKEDWLKPSSVKGILIYGAGVAGITLAREIRNNISLGYRAIGFLDDDPNKQRAKLTGLPVLGSGNEARRVVETSKKNGQPIQEIVVAMPSATGLQIRAAVARGEAAGVPCRIVPGLGELLSGKLAVGSKREISVTDLLGREPVELDPETVRPSVCGRNVMVTGAAGSVGSELCHQLASLEPRRLLILDSAESPLFLIAAELRSKYPELDLVAEVGDIRDARQIEHVIETNSVNSIYHAAAYKHVPLMERQICEAVRNNVIGTWNVAQAALRTGVSSFLLISTDKAVNPSSIMGLTKRVAELIVSARRSQMDGVAQTKFACVRFGNVLVSNGSVVPIFQKQIETGGPVTVTHPDMRRYFMTVQEAVHLVLRASAMGQNSEVFVLDMGNPVPIVELARKMITLAGFVPDEDIEIQFTGLRPGEKIFEELSLHDENTIPTSHARIGIFQGRQLDFHELVPWVSELQHLLWQRDSVAVLAHLAALVPEYRPDIHREPARRPALTAVTAGSPSLAKTFKTAAG